VPGDLPPPRIRTDTRSARWRADRIAFRRALSLLAMTLLVPGSAQLLCGNRRVGRVAVRVWAVVALVLGGLAVAIWVDPGIAIRLGTDPTALLAVRVSLIVGAISWVVLLLDAWRLGDPPRLPRSRRLVLAGVSAAFTALLSISMLFSAHVVAVQREVLIEVFGDGHVVKAEAGRYNVLLLGGDSSATRWGLRPDSVTLASIDAESGRTVLFGLPRNLANVPFPEGSPMHQRFPDGFDCQGCYFNGVYTYALDHPKLFPNSDNPGLDATTSAVEEITGLPVHYYAMVNMQGFQKLVDAVGGVTLRVRTPIAIGGVGGEITGTIQPGTRHLDGYQTLWYARSRAYDDDYSRMGRQKCVMAAMLQQLSPQRVLLHVQEIAKASAELLSTDIPHGELDTFVELALRARKQPVATVSFVPPMVVTGDPDYGLIRVKVAEAIARAAGERTGDSRRRQGEDRTDRAVQAANQAKDLGAAC